MSCAVLKSLTIATVMLVLPGPSASQSLQDRSLENWIASSCEQCAGVLSEQTGIYILERGEEALMGRAWLANHAQATIDVQYFIWSTDNIGILAAEMLLGAADRGVRVRVIVDDFLIDAADNTLALLAAHPSVDIRIYNPQHKVGTSTWRRILNSITDFRGVNQRMHDKTAIFDGIAGITGGRNMADEYFDFDHEYNFRDRDVLVLGAAVTDMTANFEEFWASDLSVPVESLLPDAGLQVSDADVQQRYDELRAYARNPENFELAIRRAIERMPTDFPQLLQAMEWQAVTFISDAPGKNSGEAGLGGGGEATSALVDALGKAQRSVVIQSPYLVLPEGGVELLESLHARGVRIRISTNSLASTDNLAAFSGYFAQRPALLSAGVEIFEFRDHPQIQTDLIERHAALADTDPIFAIHAKSMVIDDELIYIGTFNLDPRSANLNTEVGVLVESAKLAAQLTQSIERDMAPANSWQTTVDYNPDREVDRRRRFMLALMNLFPIDPIL